MVPSQRVAAAADRTGTAAAAERRWVSMKIHRVKWGLTRPEASAALAAR